MSAPVDVVIAVHTPRRPIGRAVASVLDGNVGDVRLTVVCHDVPAETIAAVLSPQHRSRVHFLEHCDGVRSPAGPFNAGMRAAEGEFVSIMGSDDVLEPGAVRSWLALARRTGAETIVSRLVLGKQRRPVPTPPVRPTLRGIAHPIRDRLSYRSAPLGLVANEARQRLGAELMEGVAVGDDVPYVTRLWFETRVAVDRHGPAYVVGEDATDRVTYAPRPIATELAFVRHLLEQPWFHCYDLAARRAICVKLTRIHLFGAVHNRPALAFWTESERLDLARMAERLLAAAPGFERVLSLADRVLLDAIRLRRASAERLIAASVARRRHGHPRTLVPRNPSWLFAREAPLRLMAASFMVR